MKNILLIGAGKSATACLEFLAKQSADGSFGFTVADASLELIKEKTRQFEHVQKVVINITDAKEREALLRGKDVAISLLPPQLHILIAKECLHQKVHLLNASYQDENIKLLDKEIKAHQLLFISELGLDPGIDHMSAMQLIARIKKEGGIIDSFVSHCGGLVAEGSDNNPWHYKISWNPKNIVTAGKAGAHFLEDGNEVVLNYEALFKPTNSVQINGTHNKSYGFYPNRDSLTYLELYALENAKTFMRTTLRHPMFLVGWGKIVALKLTEDTVIFDSNQMSIGQILQEHLTKNDLINLWNELRLDGKFREQIDFLLSVQEDALLLRNGVSICDVLQHSMEKKLSLSPHDKDMIVMQHEIIYRIGSVSKSISSSLVIEGDDAMHTAMAKTVGLPLAITALLIIENKIKLSGLHIPIVAEIYEPVLQELKKYGIVFEET